MIPDPDPDFLPTGDDWPEPGMAASACSELLADAEREWPLLRLAAVLVFVLAIVASAFQPPFVTL
jgi:hypothetical protein